MAQCLVYPSKGNANRLRNQVTPARRDRGNKPKAPAEEQQTADRNTAMSRAQRLKRVINIDVQTCSACGGNVKVIACIEDPVIIDKILNHLILNTPAAQATLPNSRAPPRTALSD